MKIIDRARYTTGMQRVLGNEPKRDEKFLSPSINHIRPLNATFATGMQISNAGSAHRPVTPGVSVAPRATLSRIAAIAATEFSHFKQHNALTGLSCVKTLGLGAKTLTTGTNAGHTLMIGEARIAHVVTEDDGTESSVEETHIYAIDSNNPSMRGYGCVIYNDKNNNKCVRNMDFSELGPDPLILPLIVSMCLPQVMDVEMQNAVEAISKIPMDLLSGGKPTVGLATDLDYLTPCARIADSYLARMQKDELTVFSETAAITEAALSKGEYRPGTTMAGSVFQNVQGVYGNQVTASICTGDLLCGQWAINGERQYSKEESAMIPTLGRTYLVPSFVERMCKHVQRTGFRNLLMEGPPGSGKTLAAAAVAQGLGMPHITQLCTKNTSEDDLYGHYAPKTERDNKVFRDLSVLSSMKGGVTLPNVAAVAGLPALADVILSPAKAYAKMLGLDPEACESAKVYDALTVYTERMFAKMQELLEYKPSSVDRVQDGEQFVFVKSPLVMAIENGWCCEVQEAAVIEDPRTLKALNSLLDDCQKIDLPTGETVTRHKDAVLIFTGNMETKMDSSVRSRIQYIEYVDMPSKDECITRIISQTGFENKEMLGEMVDAFFAMRDKVEELSYTDDQRLDFRTLMYWAKATLATGDAYNECLPTVVNSVAVDDEIKQAMMDILMEREPSLKGGMLV